MWTFIDIHALNELTTTKQNAMLFVTDENCPPSIRTLSNVESTDLLDMARTKGVQMLCMSYARWGEQMESHLSKTYNTFLTTTHTPTVYLFFNDGRVPRTLLAHDVDTVRKTLQTAYR